MRKLFAALLIILAVSPIWAAIAFVQGTSTDGGTTLAYPSNVTAGSLLILVYRCGANDATPTATDTLGNTWSTAKHQAYEGVTAGLTILYALNSGGGANTVTPGNVSSCGTKRWTIEEYSGVATSSALDQVNGANCVSGSCSSGNITPSQADEVVICGGQDDDNAAAPSAPFTRRDDGNKVYEADDIISSVTPLQCTQTGSATNQSIIVASFKAPAGGGGGTITNPRRVIISE